MIRVVTLTFVVAMGLILGGCSMFGGKSASAPQSADVLNVAAAPTPTPAPEPVAVAPISDAPIAMATPTPAPVTESIAATPASKTYTIKKGDTLFSIAKNQMGSGRDWQKLAAANPGIDPHKLKVGQTVTIPS